MSNRIRFIPTPDGHGAIPLHHVEQISWHRLPHTHPLFPGWSMEVVAWGVEGAYQLEYEFLGGEDLHEDLRNYFGIKAEFHPACTPKAEDVVWRDGDMVEGVVDV